MPPFNGQSDQEIMKKVRVGKFSFADPSWSNVSDKAKDLISKLLTYDVEVRPSAEVALQHIWITEMSSQVIDQNVAIGALTNLKTFQSRSETQVGHLRLHCFSTPHQERKGEPC